MPAWIKREEWEDKYGYDYDILYWRKCWNVRAEILSYLPSTHDDGGEFDMTLDQLQDILGILKNLYTKANWDEGRSIWSWNEIKKTYPANLKYARSVLKWLKTKPEESYRLYFYDSYQEEKIIAKEIVYTRVEYVRDYYEVAYGEKDYNDLVKRLSERNNPHDIVRYEVLKNLSFEDIVAIFNNEKEDIEYELTWNRDEYQWKLVEYVGYYIRTVMQEDALNIGCYNSECCETEEGIEIQD